MILLEREYPERSRLRPEDSRGRERADLIAHPLHLHRTAAGAYQLDRHVMIMKVAIEQRDIQMLAFASALAMQ